MNTPKEIFLKQQTYATLFSLANKIQVKGDQCLKYFTGRQMMAMIAILHLPEGKASLNNIAHKLGTTKQSVKQLITVLEKKGYVVTEPNQQDRRAVNITITSTAHQALLEDNEAGLRFFDNLFHEFSPKELETLWTLLKKLYRFDGEEQDGFEEETEYQHL
ncbi:MAG TPA: MarR family winged helix-turn-helix transcriptional regulator [Anaerolineaceae bacterium]|nr:MarR family winged helix-turn-helix transcriptional regulator [Anaerolineaceae bacterium]HPN52624.1 MarR family winged helix-turn-helix transcriptional regulator [Anaerolineaceae bacterium]